MFLQKAEAATKEACNFINKETPTRVFSCEFCEIFKSTFFYMAPLVAASEKISVEEIFQFFFFLLIETMSER